MPAATFRLWTIALCNFHLRLRPAWIINILKLQALSTVAFATDVEGVPGDVDIHAPHPATDRPYQRELIRPAHVSMLLWIWTALKEQVVTQIHGPRIEGTEHRRTPCVIYYTDVWGRVTKYDLRLMMLLSLYVSLYKTWWMLSDSFAGLEEAKLAWDHHM